MKVFLNIQILPEFDESRSKKFDHIGTDLTTRFGQCYGELVQFHSDKPDGIRIEISIGAFCLREVLLTTAESMFEFEKKIQAVCAQAGVRRVSVCFGDERAIPVWIGTSPALVCSNFCYPEAQ